jgi:hypothetical protein
MGFGLVTVSCLIVWGCDGPRYDTNEKVLASVNLGDAFKTLNLPHGLHRKGGSQSAGYSNKVFENDAIYTISGNTSLPEDFSKKLAHAMANQITNAGGSIQAVRSTSEIWYVKDTSQIALESNRPDTLGAKVLFSIAGSKGVITLRYTAVKADDVIGYLSCEMVEFRN